MKKINLLSFCCALLLPCAVATAENVVTLTEETEAITLADGDVLTGIGGANTHVTIADGASVTLSGVTIAATTWWDEDHKWAGLTCLGNATITLADGTTNTIKGGHYEYPGIYVAENFTLTIEGDGTLETTGGYNAAGIGGGYQMSCGNITINSGTITASSENGFGAGIGGGYNLSSCGNITINGGTITATSSYGACIGSGYAGSCGNITIKNSNVTALTSADNISDDYYGPGGAGIGAGVEGTCGNIYICNSTVDARSGGDSAGIGNGAYGSTCGDITIIGGTVSAYGSLGVNYGSAGIGSGTTGPQAECVCGVITIYSNNVTAQGSGDAANIGSGASYSSAPFVCIIKEVADQTWTGSAITPELDILVYKDNNEYDENILTKNVDYTVEITNNIVDSAKVTIQGIGDYAAYKSVVHFNITASITADDVTVASANYTGEEQTPVVTVKIGETTIGQGSYEVELPEGGCTNAGDYTVIIKGKGNISGEITKTFTISQAEPAVPENLVATQGQTLAEVELPEGWAWNEPTTNVGNEIGDKTFPATYAGSTNYKATTADLTVTISRGTVTAVNGVDVEKQHATKYLENGMLIIEVNGVKYDITGKVVK